MLVSLAAQVARAKPSVWGWIGAALPGLAFLAIVKIVLTRTSIVSGPVRTEVVSGPDQTAAEEAGPVEKVDRWVDLDLGPVESTNRSTEPDGRTRSVAPANSSLIELIRSEIIDGPDEAERRDVDRAVEDLIVPAQRIDDSDVGCTQTGIAEDESLGSQSGPHGTRTGSVRDRSDVEVSGPDRRPDSDLPGLDRTMTCWSWEKTITTMVAMWKETLTRKLLIDEIRRADGTIGTDRATKLLRLIKKSEAASVGAD